MLALHRPRTPRWCNRQPACRIRQLRRAPRAAQDGAEASLESHRVRLPRLAAFLAAPPRAARVGAELSPYKRGAGFESLWWAFFWVFACFHPLTSRALHLAAFSAAPPRTARAGAETWPPSRGTGFDSRASLVFFFSLLAFITSHRCIMEASCGFPSPCRPRTVLLAGDMAEGEAAQSLHPSGRGVSTQLARAAAQVRPVRTHARSLLDMHILKRMHGRPAISRSETACHLCAGGAAGDASPLWCTAHLRVSGTIVPQMQAFDQHGTYMAMAGSDAT